MPAFALIDWLVLAAYLAVVVTLGFVCGRRKAPGDELFLAGRSMPSWAVALSVVATSLSAATFIGGPQQAYAGNLTYFSANIGGLVAAFVIAFVFVPAFYRHRVTSIYEVLGHTYGTPARQAASAMFMGGRLLASGARLYMVALPFSLVVFGDVSFPALLASIAIVACAATAYTIAGGIRAVIWTDTLQAVIVFGTVTLAIVLLLDKIPASTGEIMEALRTDSSGDKLKVVDTSFDFTTNYTLWTALIGFALFNLAAFGTDQDLTQRLLTCKDARAGARSIIAAQLIAWPMVFLFLVLGLLLYVFHQRPDVMGDVVISAAHDDTRRVFLDFILTEMPSGIRGLMIAGLLAAAMSSTDSALNAMSSTVIADFRRPSWQRAGVEVSAATEAKESRVIMAIWGVALACVAAMCAYGHDRSETTLIDFALGIMVYAYSGTLAVFLTALLTKRGNAPSVAAALAVGVVSVWALQTFTPLAFPWRMVAATGLAFAVCCIGTRPTQNMGAPV